MELSATVIIKIFEDMESRIDKKTEELFPSKDFKSFFIRRRCQKALILESFCAGEQL